MSQGIHLEAVKHITVMNRDWIIAIYTLKKIHDEQDVQSSD